MALTTKHAQLLKSNRALLLTFEGLPVTVKLSAVAIALALACGGGIQALKGTASDTVQACIRNRQQTLQCADKSGKPYTMTNYHVQQWIENGVPGEVVFKKSVPATNPHKTLWMLLSACSFGAAGVGLRSLQNSERQLATYEAIAEKRDLAKGEIAARGELLDDYRGVAISEVHLQADLEAAANDRAVVLKQCEVLGEADIKIAQLDAEEAIFEAETAGLSDDKKQEYMEFLRNQKTPFLLSGTQTLAGINNPGDKVDQSVAAPAIEPNPNLETSRQIAAKVLNSLAGINTSIFLAAPTRCGKTHTLHKWLGDLTTRFPQADIYVISQKYEDFPGVASNRLMVFDPMQVEQSMQFLDDVYEKLLARKSKPATEETYRNRPIKLILEDWFATHQCLAQKKNTAVWESVAAKLGMIATVGGQYNVGYFICTQSFNIASSGVADSNIRLNLALLAQGLVRTTGNGEEQGSYGVIEQMLNNPNVIASKESRDRLAADLKLLIEPSMTEQTPVILSTIGNPVLGLMPKIEVNKPSVDAVPIGNTPNISENSGTPKNTLEPEPEQPGSHAEHREHLSEMLEQLLSGTVEKAVFAADSTLEHWEKMELAKLIIKQELGQERTIWLLWGVRRGGRNHALYTEARAMLERLIKGEDSNDA
ncbi:hypothetical protein C7B69_00500 [filamentous cyanobacterium Phorm 46]|nr:hypothetical protein C7B69_00500 [filamentous cyanobacterium Phorm 46]